MGPIRLRFTLTRLNEDIILILIVVLFLLLPVVLFVDYSVDCCIAPSSGVLVLPSEVAILTNFGRSTFGTFSC